MIKYAVYTESYEFNPRKYPTPEDAWIAYDDHYNKKVELCDTLEDARKVLQGIKVTTHSYSYDCAYAEVAYIEEADWDLEDGEWEFVSGSNVYDFKFKPLENC